MLAALFDRLGQVIAVTMAVNGQKPPTLRAIPASTERTAAH